MSSAAKKIEELFGITIEVPTETTNDLIREAQAVINYFQSNSSGFKTKECKYCHHIFAYSWDVEGIAYCSVTCMKMALQAIGLTWNPTKRPSERWGRTVPAVVPPAALSILQDLVGAQEDRPDSTLNE